MWQTPSRRSGGSPHRWSELPLWVGNKEKRKGGRGLALPSPFPSSAAAGPEAADGCSLSRLAAPHPLLPGQSPLPRLHKPSWGERSGAQVLRRSKGVCVDTHFVPTHHWLLIREVSLPLSLRSFLNKETKKASGKMTGFRPPREWGAWVRPQLQSQCSLLWTPHGGPPGGQEQPCPCCVPHPCSRRVVTIC